MTLDQAMVSSIRHQTHKRQMSNRHVGLRQTQQLSRTKNTIQGEDSPQSSGSPCGSYVTEGSGMQSTERTLTAQQHDNPIAKRAKDFYRQMAKDHMERCSASSVIRECTSHPQGGQNRSSRGDTGAPPCWGACGKQQQNSVALPQKVNTQPAAAGPRDGPPRYTRGRTGDTCPPVCLAVY